jgi:prephenate dehydrogenase
VNQLRTAGTVRIVGAGLLGTSIGLALRQAGADVVLADQSKASVALAVDYGAGRAAGPDDQPSLIVVCVPPDQVAEIVERELAAWPRAIVTDVASVKGEILASLRDAGVPLQNYVGSHPMAGRERGGAISGRADLFFTMPWVLAIHEGANPAAVAAVEALALDLGATPIRTSPEAHDHAVALVSHVPQLVSSLLASRLVGAEPSDLALAGQGLRDTTRIAASDPKLWLQIFAANSTEVVTILKQLSRDLADAIFALDNLNSPGSLAKLGEIMASGNAGVAGIPGKHGTRNASYAELIVLIDDKPGELARLLTEIGEIGINLEDLKLEHSPGAQIGLVELYVLPKVEVALAEALVARGWRLAG